jgi:hypothetical protein
MQKGARYSQYPYGMRKWITCTLDTTSRVTVWPRRFRAITSLAIPQQQTIEIRLDPLLKHTHQSVLKTLLTLLGPSIPKYHNKPQIYLTWTIRLGRHLPTRCNNYTVTMGSVAMGSIPSQWAFVTMGIRHNGHGTGGKLAYCKLTLYRDEFKVMLPPPLHTTFWKHILLDR